MVTIKELQQVLAVNTFLEVYLWIIENGYKDAYAVRIVVPQTGPKRSPRTIFTFIVQEVKAQAMDEVFKTLQP